MNNRVLLLLGTLTAAVALFVYSRTRRGELAATDTLEEVIVTAQRMAETVGKWISRGLRNNNPGNVREAKGDLTNWTGERATDDDSAFEEFTDMKYGVRAAAIVFRNYQRKYNLDTVAQLIARWAPPTENNTGAYVAAVAARVGTNSDTSLDLSDTDLLERFLRAVFRHENGLEADLIPDSVIREGIRLA